ncbi:PLP-dependent aminotransferase family protein [Rhodococcus sp. BGS-1C]|jgi:2-aminoadipate transaminase|uniref:aminotransferase-like domain-containing protein n=1 Tax=unclassified Rhodococcus (in: high G+C Gram-positive bacteria) TaxID=192944 RepID=UPI0009665821|nr:PLP-dependent aminotransferase family protein [Rhodococcus sp. KRD197]OLT32043.1 aspartate aminotransferase [Rhodococcus sp. CUA-806]
MIATTIPWSLRTDKLVGSVIDSSTSLLAAQKHDIVRFAMGSPAAETVPAAAFSDIASTVMTSDAMDYGATEGDPRLLDSLIGYLDSVGEPSSADRIVITSGGMQGLDLACKLFVDPGDLVIVESPTYTNGTATVLSYGGDVLEAPMDADGLVVEALEDLVEQAGRRPKMIYVIPNFQNPSGTTMSQARRVLLLELAHKWGSIILDDDPYGLLRFEGEHIPSFAALSPNDPLLFSVRTFSKMIAPGLRVGWVDAAPEARQLLINAKQAMDTCTNLPAQRMIAEFIDRGHLATHITSLAGVYRPRKVAMQRSLKKYFGDLVSTTDPEGGFFLWATLRGSAASISTQDLFEVALAEGVAYIPGPALSVGGKFHDSLRLCFASSSPERIDEGVKRLAAAVDKATSMLASDPTR